MLANPTPAEREVLGAIGYTVNPAVLHTDTSVLPRAPRAQASWNYVLPTCTAEPTSVHLSYNMNRLQRLTADETYVVTLNGDDRVAPAHVIDPMVYEHPVYTADRSRPSAGCPNSTTARSPSPVPITAGVSTRTAAARVWPPRRAWAGAGERPAHGSTTSTSPMSAPSPCATRSAIAATSGSSTSTTCPACPRPLAALARFEARDHLGDPAAEPPRERRRLPGRARHRPARGAITMLANPRSLGYVFNPLSLFWCHDAGGAVVARRRRGAQHLRRGTSVPAAPGRCRPGRHGQVALRLAVLPGRRLLPAERAGARRAGGGHHHPAPARPAAVHCRGPRFCAAAPATRSVLRTAFRYPLETWLIRALITAHGIRLWRKGLPVQPRPERQEGTMSQAAGGGAARRLERTVREVTGSALPVRVRAWDGSEAGPADGPVVIVRNRRALRRLLWAPGELGLARAYVTGDLDVEAGAAPGPAPERRASRGVRARSGPSRGRIRAPVRSVAPACRPRP